MIARVLFLVLLSCTACQKYDDVKEKSVFELLTAGPWRLESLGYDDNKNGKIDGNEESIEDCHRDNTLEFFKDGKGLVLENEISCGGMEEQEFTWKLINNNKKLDLQYGFFNINILNDSQLILSYSYSDVNGGEFIFFVIYRH